MKFERMESELPESGQGLDGDEYLGIPVMDIWGTCKSQCRFSYSGKY